MMSHPNRKPLIGVIGNNAVPLGDARIDLAYETGRALVDAGCRVVCGGMGGVMEAACRGARDAARYQSGDVIGLLPGGGVQEANAFVDIALPTGLGLARNSLVAHADALIAIGGGAGTLSEMAYGWQYDRLVIGMRCEGWSGELADRRLDERIRDPNIENDRVYGAGTTEEALAILREWLPVYRSGLTLGN